MMELVATSLFSVVDIMATECNTATRANFRVTSEALDTHKDFKTFLKFNFVTLTAPLTCVPQLEALHHHTVDSYSDRNLCNNFSNSYYTVIAQLLHSYIVITLTAIT